MFLLILCSALALPTAAYDCASATANLQAILDATAKNGGGWAPLPCGHYATLALTLPSSVKLGRCLPVPGRPGTLTLGACEPGKQQHIISVGNGTGQAISGVYFDHANLTDPSTRSSCAVTGGSGSVGFLLENSHFLNINTTSQGFSAIQMSGCSGCIVRGNVVPRSGGDALNFNSGTYIVTENLVENVGDGCIAMNNNAFGLVSNNVLRSCNLGVGAGPSGSASSFTDSTPFAITGNQIEDCDYGVLLGWFGYKGRVGPVATIVSDNIILRPRSSGIQNNGGPGAFDGSFIVHGNQITHAGSPATQPPHTSSRLGPGHGIVASSVRDVQISGNLVSHGRGDGITAQGLHFVIADNIVQADSIANATGITVSDSIDAAVTGNNVRGFGTAVSASDKDRLVVRGNSIDISHSPDAQGVVVGAAAARFVANGNTISGAVHGEAQCLVVAGKASGARVVKDNLCW